MSLPVVPFAKMEGLGNDFIVVDLRDLPDPRGPHDTESGSAAPPWLDDDAVIRALCDRHRGIGADGVLAILPAPAGSPAAARMRVRNADGSEAEMCGNGLRCVARFLVDHDRGEPGRAGPLARARDFLVETGAGRLRCVLHGEPGGPDDSVEIAMGAPRLRRREIPMRGEPESLCIAQPLQLADGSSLVLTAVSMGNPHAVCFVDGEPAAHERSDLHALAARLGPEVERLPLFPQRTNVELVRPAGDGVFSTVVWERGCGLTLACGTGACAVAVAACRTGRAAYGRWLTVVLPGGPLQIHVRPDESDVLLRGPARPVFRGEVDLAALPKASTV
ncbi:MAG: diaminopimelate epimerase [Polyangia bacterium]